MAAVNLDRVRNAVKKAQKDVEKIDNEKVNPFKVIARFLLSSRALMMAQVIFL